MNEQFVIAILQQLEAIRFEMRAANLIRMSYQGYSRTDSEVHHCMDLAGKSAMEAANRMAYEMTKNNNKEK